MQTIPRLVFASLAINALVFVMMLRQRKLMGMALGELQRTE
jgi:hypothetical protein